MTRSTRSTPAAAQIAFREATQALKAGLGGRGDRPDLSAADCRRLGSDVSDHLAEIAALLRDAGMRGSGRSEEAKTLRAVTEQLSLTAALARRLSVGHRNGLVLVEDRRTGPTADD